MSQNTLFFMYVTQNAYYFFMYFSRYAYKLRVKYPRIIIEIHMLAYQKIFIRGILVSTIIFRICRQQKAATFLLQNCKKKKQLKILIYKILVIKVYTRSYLLMQKIIYQRE